jgi:hypothetical protein
MNREAKSRGLFYGTACMFTGISEEENSEINRNRANSSSTVEDISFSKCSDTVRLCNFETVHRQLRGARLSKLIFFASMFSKLHQSEGAEHLLGICLLIS